MYVEDEAEDVLAENGVSSVLFARQGLIFIEPSHSQIRFNNVQDQSYKIHSLPVCTIEIQVFKVLATIVYTSDDVKYFSHGSHSWKYC